MKNVLFVVLLAAVITSCSDSNDLKDWELNGKVKTVLYTFYEPENKFGKWVEGSIQSYSTTRGDFDKNGKLQETTYYSSGDRISGKFIKINDNESIYYDAEGKLENSVKYYKVSGNTINEEIFDKDGKKLADRSFNTKLKNGRVVNSKATIQKDGEIEIYITNSIYKKGNLIHQETTKETGEIVSVSRFEYLEFDAKKNWIKRLQFTGDNKEPLLIAVRKIEYYN